MTTTAASDPPPLTPGLADPASATDVPDPPVPTPTVTYRALLRNANFRLLWLGQAASTFGTFFTRIAIPIYVYNLTGSLTHLGLAAFSSLLPALVFGLFAGALADRWNRRTTMIGTDLANVALLMLLIGLAVVPLPATIALGAQTVALALPIKLGCLYLINFAAGMLRELYNPARVAIFADVLPDEALLSANSLDEATKTFGELASYPLAAALLWNFGPQVAFGIDAATFLLSALLLGGVHAPRPHSDADADAGTTIWSEIGAGLAALRQLPVVQHLVMLSLVVPLLFSLMTTLQLPYVARVLGSNEAVGYPTLEGAMALGVIVGMLLLGHWAHRVQPTTLLAYGIGSMGAIYVALGWLPQLDAALGLSFLVNTLNTQAGPLFGMTVSHAANSPITPLLIMAIPLSFVGGAMNSLILASIRTILQQQTPRPVLGRVASVVNMAAGFGFSVGALLTGLGEGRITQVFMIVGGLMISIGVASFWWLHRAAPVALAREAITT